MSEFSEVFKKQADDCYKKCKGDCMVESSDKIKLHLHCNYCKKVRKLKPIKQLNLIDYLKTKKCGRCEKVKPISEFNIENRTKNKLLNQCRECEKEWRSL